MVGFISCRSGETDELIKEFTNISDYAYVNMHSDAQQLAAAMINDSIKTKPYFDKAKFFYSNARQFDSLIYPSQSKSLKSKFDKDEIIKMYHFINDTLQKFCSHINSSSKVYENNYSITGSTENQNLTVMRIRTDIMINTAWVISYLLSSINNSSDTWGHEIKTEGVTAGENYILSLNDSWIQSKNKHGVSIKSIERNGMPFSCNFQAKSSDEFAKIIFPKLENGKYVIKGEVAAESFNSGRALYPMNIVFEVKE